MKDIEIIEKLRKKLSVPVGRHLYGILGTYKSLDIFSQKLQQGTTVDGRPFPSPISVNRGIIDAFSDEDFRSIVKDEAKRPEPTRKSIQTAFEDFLRKRLKENGLVILSNLELIFAYDLDMNSLRTLAADDYRIILLLSGKRVGGRVIMFPEQTDGSYHLPTNLIAEDHQWEVTY